MRFLFAAGIALLLISLHSAAGSLPQSPLFVTAPGSPIRVGPGSGEVLLADLNRDGHLDLITKHLLSQSIAVRLGDGTGVFKPSVEGPLRLGYQPGAIALGDVNNDGILDLGVASREGDKEFVRALLGTGRGTFREASGAPFAVSASFQFYKPILYLVDIDEDKMADIVTANGRRDRIDIVFGNGQGGFSKRSSVFLESGGDRYSFAPGDTDGDGHVDLVAAKSVGTDRTPGPLQIKRGDGKGAFVDASRSIPPVLPNPRLGALADVNGDKYVDIVVTYAGSRQVGVLLSRGNGMFMPAPAGYGVAGEANEVVVIDVNRDGRNDLVAATVDSVTVLLGGSDGFRPARGSPYRAGPGAYHVSVGDVNGDGKVDLVASSFDGDVITLLLGR